MSRRSFNCSDGYCGAEDCARCRPYIVNDAPDEREEAEPREWTALDDAALDGEGQDRSDRFHEAQLRKDRP